jgi:two-component system NtrC family sensor kinase
MKILIADDSKVVQYKLTEMLASWGYESIAVSNGEEAFNVITSDPTISVAIIDWNMPDICGPVLCSKIRKSKEDYLYIIILTSLQGTDKVVEGLNAGADDFVIKSNDMSELKVRLQAGARIAALQTTLIEANREKSLLLASIPSFYLSIDPDLHIKTANAAAIELFELPTINYIGESLDKLRINWNWEVILPAMAECRDNNSSVRLNDISLQLSNSEYRRLILTVNPIDEHASGGFLLIGDDVTVQRRLELELNQKNRHESIGQFTTGITHELNTPLQYIGDNLLFLKNSFDELSLYMTNNNHSPITIDSSIEEVPAAIDEALSGVRRATDIVSAINRFSSLQSINREDVDINSLIDEVLILSESVWKYSAEIERSFDLNLPKVHCHRGELCETMLHLIKNAVEAIQSKSADIGKISIRTFRSDINLGIEICDNGCGIAEEIKGEIFTPFFSTKKPVGAGLGKTYDVIVRQHAGSISFDSQPGNYTKLSILIPLI